MDTLSLEEALIHTKKNTSFLFLLRTETQTPRTNKETPLMKLQNALFVALAVAVAACIALCASREQQQQQQQQRWGGRRALANSTSKPELNATTTATPNGTFGGGRYPSRVRRPPERFIDNMEEIYGQSYIDFLLEDSDLEKVLEGEPEDGTPFYDGPGEYESNGLDLTDDPNAIWLTDAGDEEWLPGDL